MSGRTVPDWVWGGLWLSAAFFPALALVKPIGVSTQFVIPDGIPWNAFDSDLVSRTEDGYTNPNAYLTKSDGKNAKAVAALFPGRRRTISWPRR